MDILSELQALKADYSAAQTLLEEAKQAGESLTASLSTSKESIKEQAAELADLKGSISAKDKELGILQAELRAMKAAQKSAEEKAVEIVANVGIKPMKADYSAEAAAMDKAKVIHGLHSIKDPVERANFYFANRKVLFGK